MPKTVTVSEKDLRALISANAGVYDYISCDKCPAQGVCDAIYTNNADYGRFEKGCRDAQLRYFGLEVK